MPNFAGTWKMRSSENFDELLKALGVNAMLRKVAVAAASKPHVEIRQDGDQFYIKTSTTVRTTEINFKIGESFEEETVDGRKCRSLATWENENKIYCKQTLIEGDGPKTYWTRELANDELILTFGADDVVCTRIYAEKYIALWWRTCWDMPYPYSNRSPPALESVLSPPPRRWMVVLVQADEASSRAKARSPYQPVIEALGSYPQKKFYNVSKLGGAKYDTLPYSIRVLFESSIRNCDGFLVKEADAMNILDWKTKQNNVEVPFCPARVVLQDFTPETVLKNQEMEFGRNRERLQFFKWSSKVFKNISVIPPETGMAHQVNLEYLSRVVFEVKDFLYPDSVVGTDSHTTMVNGLGILGWGVGGIETEAVMLGMPVTLTLPEVVGCELTGTASPLATSIDIVLSITKQLKQADVAGKFVEFFGSGVSQLSVADRTTIANMCPEYGAILSFFPVDNVTLKHLKHTGSAN
ncbi:hypothetical protein llap_12104 [Limosa lapponica baueri]|uniref:Cytosolic fatty-acid binding proteins domain-containing protein n=72 Tax=Neognathae TaxID=8825 RepID=A0A2I0TUV9_LIMLA|nr:hypothetical protein llap_12104 [Limosa lapponica baueri]